MIGLFCSNRRMVIFSKTENKFVSQETCKGTKHLWLSHGIRLTGVLKFVKWLFKFIWKFITWKFVTFYPFTVPLLVDEGGRRSKNWSFLMDIIDIWPLNGSPVQLLESVVSPLTSRQIHFEFIKNNSQRSPSPPQITPLPTPLLVKPKYLLLALDTCCGLFNIVSWLADYKIL